MLSTTILLLGTFGFGSIIGSFLNVCIYRIPAGESVVRPRSRCPLCHTSIAWYQNVPILSYLLLRGRCGSCGGRISPRYAFVEALTGGLFLAIVYRFGLQPLVPMFWFFVAALIAITFIDFDHQIIPDVLSLPGIAVGFSLSLTGYTVPWFDSLGGVLLGGGLLLGVAWGYEMFTGKEGMGGGDIKLLAMIGAFLGWRAILPVLFLSSIFGVLLGIPFQMIQKESGKMAIPFGPFLSLGAVVWLLVGDSIWQWYVSAFIYQ